MGYPKTPALMTDCAVFHPDGRVLLVRRKNEPFAGRYALPGGFVDLVDRLKQLAAENWKRRLALQ